MPYSRLLIQSTLPSNGDNLQRRDSTSLNEICKTSFIAARVRAFLDANPSISYVRIDQVTPPPGPQKFFRMLACDSDDNILDNLVGHLPCPEDCVPPEPPFLPRDNSFDIAHVNLVLAFPAITHVNVHSSVRHYSLNAMETHSIYAVTGWPDHPQAHHGPRDPAFTSIVATP